MTKATLTDINTKTSTTLNTTTTLNLRHFKTPEEALSHLIEGALLDAREDRDRMHNSEAHHYTDEDRSEADAKVNDFEQVVRLRLELLENGTEEGTRLPARAT